MLQVPKSIELYKLKKGLKYRFQQGHLLVLNKDKFLAFTKKQSKNISPEGVLIKENADYFTIKKILERYQLIERVSIDHPPMNVTLKVTDHCNLKCAHCHSSFGSKDEFDLQSLKKIIDELAEMNVFNINISGGEPLLRRDIFEIVRYIRDKGIKVTMSTNGTFISDEIAVKLKEAGISQCHVSLDSVIPEKHDAIRGVKGAFNKALKGIKSLQNAGIDVMVVTVLTNQTPEEYRGIIKFCEENKIPAHKTNPLIPSGKGKEILRSIKFYDNPEPYLKIWMEMRTTSKVKLYAEPSFLMMGGKEYLFIDNKPDLFEIGCPAGIDTCAINENGDVLPCSFFTELPVGNINTSSFYDIWYKNELFKELRERNFKCKAINCELLNKCGGCRARAYYANNDLSSADIYCFKLRDSNAKQV